MTNFFVVLMYKKRRVVLLKRERGTEGEIESEGAAYQCYQYSPVTPYHHNNGNVVKILKDNKKRQRKRQVDYFKLLTISLCHYYHYHYSLFIVIHS